ncbi:hypothetical protein [Streptomyces sp. SID3212]|uniref:hypothetical protein n=1 Tax=Streptomyces sp. SID3212 TaxID=2690259 RepID=UPI001371506F|nr:hypothetical protein [Streptomyces sp. SID3212]MYV51342.1 hypothetical protein [Streptomyces sp. SID3212]
MMLLSESMFSGGPSVYLRPLRKAQMTRGWVLEAPVAELASLAAEANSPRRLRARRGFLYDSDRTLALARLLEESPEDFGAVGAIVLGADEVCPVPAAGHFTELVRVDGVECIDGLQRLRVIADACETLDPSYLARAVVRVDIVVGAERARARRLHDTADSFVNARNNQDRLLCCPNINRLMNANWERGTFDPRRGVMLGPRGLSYSMVEVSRALACLSGPGPELAHAVSTGAGLEALWGDTASESYRTLFHTGLEPVGVVRAVEAWQAAHEALDDLPASRSTRGHGHLIQYAPELICWEACRFLPRDQLHDSASVFRWERAIPLDVRTATLEAADRLIACYESAVPGMHQYVKKAPQLSLWRKLVR